MISPNYQDYKKEASLYDYVPVVLSRSVDLETVISIFIKLKGNFLLESVEKEDSLGRYSYIGLEKRKEIQIKNTLIEVTDYHKKTKEKITHYANPIDYLKEKIVPQNIKELPGLPSFTGGYLGYLGYEMVNFFEPKVPVYPWTKSDIPDAILIMPEIIIAYDNVKKTATISYLASCREEGSEKDYQAITQKLKKISAAIDQQLSYTPPLVNAQELNQKNFQFFSQKDYEEKVQAAIKQIKKGELIQVVLADRFSIKTTLTPLEVYRTLKTLNPSPYLFFLQFSDFTLIGSSPEVMVKVEKDEMLLRPLAGTRKRGATTSEDLKLKEELLADEKEIAEHIMLVDLGRNDLSKVSLTGSVKVVDYMQVDQYSQVQHIVSTIKSFKEKKASCWDVLQATFPAGTLSGAPKVRAMEIIHELEKKRRNFYGGTVFTLSLNGNLNSCITIRSILFREDHATIQAGAGIVVDSNPTKEFNECYTKASALVKALEQTYHRLKK